ncbi:MAG: hypothetical protein HQ557_10415 [Bacteroidetes bacterium]|nr:hypothetical protein [Bacteroidota bacterium]
MKEIFPGYFQKDHQEIEHIWSDCTFIFDTSVLLDLYRFSEPTVKKILKILERLGVVWIPNQVAFEFFRNREIVLSKQFSLYENFVNNFNGMNSHLQKHLKGLFSKIADEKYKANKQNHPYLANLEGLVNSYKDSFQKIDLVIDEIKGKDEISNLFLTRDYYKKLLEEDWILEALVTLFSNKTGESFNDDEIENLYTIGERRYSNSIPPGYLDEKDYDALSYGDFIIWCQIIDFSHNNQKSVIFITNDLKSDWWKGSKKKNNISPRPELINEFQRKTNQSFWMYSFDDFLNEVENNLRDIEIDDMENLKEEIQSLQDFDAEKEFIEKRIFGNPSPTKHIESIDFYLQMQDELNQVIKTLSPEDQDILNYSYGLNGYEKLSHEELSDQMGLSFDAIRQLEARALRRIRHPKRSRRLVQFIDRDP